jgi:hypothetical protein
MNDPKTIASAAFGRAPADARRHAIWPMWKKLLAYAALTCLAAGAIWFIDLRAHRPPKLRPGMTPTTPSDARVAR